MFRAFSDRTRLRILHLLQGGEMCVGDIVDGLQVPQPRVSRHLAYLRKAGLVVARKEGLWTFYSLAPAQNDFHKNLLHCLGDLLRETCRRSRPTLHEPRRCGSLGDAAHGNFFALYIRLSE